MLQRAGILVAIFWAVNGVALASDIIPADRLTVWNPGLNAVGGIPNRTTIFQTVQASTYGNGANDASAGIQAALDACPAGQVVLLSAGKFKLNNSYLLIHTGITLRGAGPGVTILEKTNGARPRTSPLQPVDPGSYSYDAQPIVIIGPSRWPGPDSTTSQNLSADGAKGGTTVTLVNATGFAAGQFVLLDEKSGASWQPTPAGFPGNAKVWQGDRVSWNMHLPVQQYQDDCNASNSSGPYDSAPGVPPDAMSWFCRTDRPTCEIKEIASVSGNTITFTTPLHISYRTSHAAQLTRYSDFSGTLSDRASAQIKNAGIEDLTTLGGADGQIRFENAAYCWASNIENTQWLGEGFAVDGSFRVEIRHSNIHDGSWPQPGGAGYAISFADGTSEVLIEDNISVNTCKNMVVRSCGAGSVFGYNFTDDAWDFDAPDWVECGLNASHMAGPHHVLFEGNYGVNFDSDYTHGNAIYMTCLRNWMSGHRFVFAPGFTDGGNLRCIGAAYGSWWDSFIGNVLGRPSQMSGWTYDDPAMTGNNSNWTDPTIWRLGYDPERWSMIPDPLTLSTVIRHGNYDYLNDAQSFDSTIADHTIPDSLYLTGKPAFFGSLPWPWVQPENGAQQLFTLPAMQRFGAAPVINSALIATGTAGTAFNYQIAATNSPTSYHATPLPAGLTVNTSTGVISGTPTTAGTTSVTISATNANGTGTATLSLTIKSSATPPVITSALTATGTVGSAFSYQVTASNSPTSYNAVPLPAGLTVNTNTGVISGTPSTAGTTSITISATNANGTGTATLSLTIKSPAAPPVITSALTATGTVGSAFSYHITASNSPTSFSAKPLPSGLTVNTSTGVISGTPTAAGTTTITISATNAAGTGTATLSLAINATPPPPAITSASTATATVGAAFTYAITATGNPTSYNAAPVPAGLTVNVSTGVISGTPTTAGTTSVTMSATNSSGTGTALLSLTINPAANTPVAYWKFDESSGTSAADSSGNGNTGTLVNAPTWGAGEVNGALTFNGKSQYVTVSAAAGGSLDLDATPVTIAAWVYTNSLSVQQAILQRGASNGVGAGQQGFGLFVNSNGKVNVGSSGGGNFDSLATLKLQTWQHVAAVINGTASKVYIDGVDQTPAAVNVKVIASNLGLTIGATRNTKNTAYARFFNGKLDDVRMYHAALSAQEIAGLAGGSPATVQAAAALAPGLALTVSHLKASVTLHASEKDRCALSGSIAGLPAEFSLGGENIAVSVGGAEASFTLDAKGRARSASGTVTCKLKNGTVTFSANLAGGLAAAWDLNASAPGSSPVILPVTLQIGGTPYSAPATVNIRIAK